MLATSIAETSLTIEGVRIVVDSGLARVPRYEPDLGLSRLETVRVSRASADQRRGRAGRTEPGIAIRLWDEAQDQGLLPFNRPEILEADLSRFRLDCAGAGIADPGSLTLLDPPPKTALREATNLLTELGALDEAGRLTARGRHLRELPLEPRLSALVLESARRGQAEDGALLAALISERGLGGNVSDAASRLERFRQERSPKAQAARNLALRWADRARKLEPASGTQSALSAGALLALAFPDRVGKARGNGAVSLSNGRQAQLDAADPLAKAAFLVAADLTGTAARARITLGAELSRAEIDSVLGHLITTQDVTRFEASAARCAAAARRGLMPSFSIPRRFLSRPRRKMRACLPKRRPVPESTAWVGARRKTSCVPAWASCGRRGRRIGRIFRMGRWLKPPANGSRLPAGQDEPQPDRCGDARSSA